MLAAGLPAAGFAQGCEETALEEGWEVTVSAELFKIKMPQFPDNPWQELAIKDDSGKTFILIEQLVKGIRKDEAKKVTITGTLMPAMFVKGEAVSVIQTKEIKALEAQDKKTRKKVSCVIETECAF